MRNPEFNKIFLQVIQINSEMLTNKIRHHAENFTYVKDEPCETEDEVRDMAVRFFTSMLAHEVAERSSRQINKY